MNFSSCFVFAQSGRKVMEEI